MSMTETVLPSFLRFREEGLIIGRILAGYGELEFEMCDCVFAINNDLDSSIRQLFGRRGELRRIKIAEELMKAQYEAAGLAAPHRAIMEDMDWCRQVRNQYAHCNWYDRENEGLCFIDLVLLCHKFFCRDRLPIGAAQHGHRDRVVASAKINLLRIVAIEFGTWRSVRSGGASRSVTVGNGKFLEQSGGTRS